MTGNAVAKLEPRRSVLIDTAARYGMEAAAFEQTLRATVVPKDCSKEQFAAFLLIAKEYDLNPLLKEIYAFPTRGGGIQPIVPIDGWTNIINSNPALDGIEFDDAINDDDKLTAVTCRIWRKDRTKPIMVTEYMAECVRNTDTWRQYPRRMLRHKALIQCARYAFGFAGIVDPDEADRIIQSDAPQIKAPRPPEAIVEASEVTYVVPPSAIPPTESPEDMLAAIGTILDAVTDAYDLSDTWETKCLPKLSGAFPPDVEAAQALLRAAEKRLDP